MTDRIPLFFCTILLLLAYPVFGQDLLPEGKKEVGTVEEQEAGTVEEQDLVAIKKKDVLTVEKAVKMTLENNYQIKTAANELKIDSISVSPGNAGMYPSLGAQITDNNSIQNLSQTRSDGSMVERNNAKNNSMHYGV